MNPLKIFLSIAALVFANAAAAGPQAEALGTCLVDSTTGKDRKELARWLFSAMGAHPSLGDMFTISDPQRDEISRSMAALVTSLMTDKCAKEVRAAIQGEGSTALRSSFEILGRVAAMELQGNAEVAKAISGFEKYLDRGKFQQLYQQQ
jgi:hypothetical protein